MTESRYAEKETCGVTDDRSQALVIIGIVPKLTRLHPSIEFIRNPYGDSSALYLLPRSHTETPHC